MTPEQDANGYALPELDFGFSKDEKREFAQHRASTVLDEGYACFPFATQIGAALQKVFGATAKSPIETNNAFLQAVDEYFDQKAVGSATPEWVAQHFRDTLFTDLPAAIGGLVDEAIIVKKLQDDDVHQAIDAAVLALVSELEAVVPMSIYTVPGRLRLVLGDVNAGNVGQ